LTYSTQAVSDDDPVDKLGLKFDGGLTAAQVQAVQALVTSTPKTLGVYPSRSVTASLTGQTILGPCAVVGIHAVTVGTGTLTVHDGRASSDPTKLRFSRASGALVAGTYYPLVADELAAMLFADGVYVSVPTGGVYLLDVVQEQDLMAASQAGLICVPSRVTTTGLAIGGPSEVVSLKVIDPGSAGALACYDAGDAANASALLHPSIAFGSLAADQIIRFGGRGNARAVGNLYVTMPTAGILLINHIPR
jgi:hypothetical protein